MDDGALLVGRSKGVGGVMLVIIGVLWWLENYRHFTRLTKWLVPLLVILLGLKMISQSALFVRERRPTRHLYAPTTR